MIKEYDYNADEMAQDVCIMTIPATNPHSLHSSRKFPTGNVNDSHRNVLHDLEQFIHQSKLKEEGRIQELKKKQKNITGEIKQRQTIKQNKRKQLELREKQRLLKECTFHPKLHNNGPRRNFNEFLQNQDAHTQKVKQKREYLKKQTEQKQEKATYRPKINSSGQKGKRTKETKGNTVYDRLYALREKQNVLDEDNRNPHHPVINTRSKNMIRNCPIDELLYSDALRRQQKEYQILVTSNSVCSKPQKVSNSNNQKYVAQKFIREFFFTLEDLKISSSLYHIVDQVIFIQLLTQMGFMTKEQQYQTQSSSYQKSFAHDAYSIISKYQANARNICVYLLALIGIYHINPVNFEEGQQSDETKQLNFDQADGRKVQKHFDLFYRNRLSSECLRRSESKSEQYSFQPKINKQSVQMAERHRNMMLEEANHLIQLYPQIDFAIPEDGVISHTDLLVLHKMTKDIEKQKTKYERQDEELKQCTFKPNTFASSLNNSKISETGGLLGYKKSHELYDYHKSLQSKKQSMKESRSDIDPQCTFKPQINKTKIPSHILGPMSKLTDETLYRLHKGRTQYEEKKKFLERGELVKNPRFNSQSSQEEKTPSLILDVNLGEQVDRIILYRGDEERLQQVAKQFSEKHSLDEESEVKLLEMLQSQMENILSKIQEDQESQDGEN